MGFPCVGCDAGVGDDGLLIASWTASTGSALDVTKGAATAEVDGSGA